MNSLHGMTLLPLSGIKVLDLTSALAGPLVAQMLGDFGADVIKVERPVTGDESRRIGPPFLKAWDGSSTRESGVYLSANRNKRSITVDLSSAQGQEIVRGLALQADVVIEDFRVGTLAGYGLDYETLSKANPKIVYLSITGYGQTGKLATCSGYDAAFRGSRDIVDILTSLYGSVAVMGALNFRNQQPDRHGQYLDLALFDSMVASLTHRGQDFLISSEGKGAIDVGDELRRKCLRELPEIFSNEQVRERGMVVTSKHPVAAVVPMIGNPIHYSETPLDRYEAPPLLGEHTEQVLKTELGLSSGEVASLKQAKVI